MSYKQMGLVELISAIQKKVESKTELRCFDAVPENEPSPFYYAQVVIVNLKIYHLLQKLLP